MKVPSTMEDINLQNMQQNYLYLLIFMTLDSTVNVVYAGLVFKTIQQIYSYSFHFYLILFSHANEV